MGPGPRCKPTPATAARSWGRKAAHRLTGNMGNGNGLVLQGGHASWILVDRVEKATDN